MAHSISRRQFLQGSGAAALSVAAAGLLSSCGGSSASNGGSTGAAGSSSTYTVLYSRQPATLNYLSAQLTRTLPRHSVHRHAGGVRQPRKIREALPLLGNGMTGQPDLDVPPAG